MVKKYTRKSLRILVFLGIILGVALLISFLNIDNMTGHVIFEEYENQTSCETAGYTWENLVKKSCENISVCINETIENCECLEYEKINETQGDCLNWSSCIKEVYNEEQNCTEIEVERCVGNVCDEEHLHLCFAEEDCISFEGYWYYNSCHREPELVEEQKESEVVNEIAEQKDNETEKIPKNKDIPDKPEIIEENFSLTNEERQILINEFGEVSVKVTKAERVNRGIEITFEFAGYSAVRFYDAEFSKEELNFQISKDRINWLKDISDAVSTNVSSEKITELIGEYSI